ncbi:MAG: hypothetical protein WAM14_05740, partial [Candidatus Nitrosopolaris sp.]
MEWRVDILCMWASCQEIHNYNVIISHNPDAYKCEKKQQQYIAAMQEGKSTIMNDGDQSKQNEDNEPSTIDDSIPKTSDPEPSAPNEYNTQGSAFPNVQKEIGQADKIQKHKEDKIINTSTQTATDVQTDPS